MRYGKALAGAIAVSMCSGSLLAGEIDRGLEEVFDASEPNEVISALAYLWEQGDIEALKLQLDEARVSRAQRVREVVTALQTTAELTQGNLTAQLEGMTAKGQVAHYQPFWVANVVRIDATENVLRQIADHPDVMRVYFNPQIENITPVEEDDDVIQPGEGAVAGSGPEPGVEAVRAPEVWAQGIDGDGIVVATLDTGVDGNHPALSSRWRGLEPQYAGNPEWAWFDPVTKTTTPQDFGFGSHGTHTMGTVCGGLPGDQVGVAPGAQWIHAAVIDRVDIPTTVADAIASFQWMVNPDGNATTVFDVPHICSNSWGVTTGHGYPNCDETFWQFIDNTEAVGIAQFFSAGNEGFSGLRRPADRATDEYRSTAVAAVNPHNSSWPIAGFSSRGPTSCTPDGTPTTKPDIAAPGVDTRSSIAGGGYGLKDGTSMASPHVNGVAALMLQACPFLTPDEVKQIIYDTAFDLGSPGKDNDYGWGMIDAVEAVAMAQASCTLGMQLPEGAPSLLDPGVQTTFPVVIVPGQEDVVPGTEFLFYRIDGGAFQQVALTNLGGDTYEATLPPVSCDSTIDFYLQAEGDGGTIRTLPANAPSSFYTAIVGEFVTVESYTENFNTGLPSGWSASGLWNVTDDCSVAGDCPDNVWAYYGQTGSCDFDTGSANEGELLSAPIAIPDVPQGGQILASFCYNLDGESLSSYDIATFSVVGGPSQVLGNSETWTTFSMNITDFAGQTIQFSWHFDTVDGVSNDHNGWQVDKIRIETTSLECKDTGTPGDLDGNGTVDVLDMLALLGAWGACDGCPADLNDDGLVNVADLLILLGNWG